MNCSLTPSVNLQDENRLRTLISMMASSLSMDVANSGHSFAVSAAAASLTPTAQFSELYDGLSQVGVVNSVMWRNFCCT